MASNNKNTGFAASTSTGDRSYFETQRAALLGEIGVSLEHTLSAINKLNRSLEGVIAVGNEFGSVEALWSTFETVMGHDANAAADTEGETEGDHDESKVGQEQGYERSDERGQGQQGNRSESKHERR